MVHVSQQARRTHIAAAQAAFPQGGDTRPLRWRGTDVLSPVVQIPVTHALLNPRSHRIKAQIEADRTRSQVIREDPYSDDAQDLIATIIKATPGYAAVKAAIARDKQRDPGVMTSEGLLINANTRLVALRELGQNHIKVHILPTDATEPELLELELGFQMESDVKQPYSFANELLLVRDLLNLGWSPEKIGLQRDRTLDEHKAQDRKLAVQSVETDARLLNLIDTVIATGGGNLGYPGFDSAEQTIKDIDATFESMRKRDVSVAERVRDAKFVGFLAGLDYRRIRAIDEAYLDEYVLTSLEEDAALKEHALDLATGDGHTGEEQFVGLEALDEVLGVEDDSEGTVTLKPVYRALAATPQDGQVEIANRDGTVLSMPASSFKAAIGHALRVAVDVKMREKNGQSDQLSPMRHLGLAATECDRAREAVTRLAGDGQLDRGRLQLAYEAYQRAHDELLMVLDGFVERDGNLGL